jgi:23S rRNA pseudouridine2605 synthase
MPRDDDKDNNSRRRPGRSSGGQGRSGEGSRGERKFGSRDFGGRGDRVKRSFDDRKDRPPRRREDGDNPRGKFSDKPRFDRNGRGEDRASRPFRPRGERTDFDRGDRPPRRREDGDRPRSKFSDRPRFDRDSRGEGDRGNRPFRPRGERNDAGREDRAPRRERSERKFEDRKFSRDDGDRKPRRDFAGRGDKRPRDFEGRDRGEMKPWQKRKDSSPDRAGRNSRPAREDARNFDRPKFDKPRYDRPRDRDEGDRPRFSRSRDDHPKGARPFGERPKFDRPRDDRRDRPRRERPEGGSDWHEHPRSEPYRRGFDRPRRDNEDDSKIFTKRPAFGGRGAYRERKPEFEKRAPREEPKPKKPGERIAKVLARAGLASRRDAEDMVTQGRVAVNGRIINSPALDVTASDVVTVDGQPLPPRERTRLFLYHKPRGLMTTHADPEGRPTVFDNLPEDLPRLISVGRLDFNTEGLLLLTNDGGLARALELPETGWLRRYRVRAHGEVTQAQLDALKNGVEVDGVKYGPIEATLERDQGANVWLVFAIREGKNREVRNVMAHLGLEVNRLIRISYGPFQLAELPEGAVEEVKTRVLREQLGEKVAKLAGADFDFPTHGATPASAKEDDAPRGKKSVRPAGRSALIADSKGRRVLVRRTGSEEARARNEEEAAGYGPPRRPKRGYHGKRDLKPRDE